MSVFQESKIGAIVTKSFPSGSILGGNPAQIIGQRDMRRYEELVREEKFYLMLKQKYRLKKKDVIDLKERQGYANGQKDTT